MKTRKLTLTALFVAIGIVLPQAIHLFGGPTLGTILLPMHLPVFIGAMLLGPVSGIFIAIASVFVGVMLGMPSILIASYMVFELVVYAFISGILYRKLKWNVFLSYLVAKLAGMVVAILVIQLYIHLFDIAFPPLFGSVFMFSAGIPGIILQILIIPTIVLMFNHKGRLSYE